jgi:hypothetical protein
MSSLERQMAESISDTHSKADKLDLSPVHDLLMLLLFLLPCDVPQLNCFPNCVFFCSLTINWLNN